MGIYNCIKDFSIECPTCGAKVDDFQTKNGDCAFSEIEFKEVDRFYTFCNICGSWIEFSIKVKPINKRTIKDYNMTVETKKERTKKEIIWNLKQ